MKKVRWGLLSTANINRRVIPAIRKSERGELVAVASRGMARASAYAAEWNIPVALDSYDALLTSDEVDALYIALPNHLHAEWTIRALRAGKHVLCEKPFALTLADVDNMVAAAEETGMVLAEAFMYRHHPQTKIIGDWVQNGRLGRVFLVRGTFNFSMGTRRENIRLAAEKGGGSLWDVGVYCVSLAQFVMGGVPERVFAQQWIGQSGVDEFFVGQMDYGNGRFAQISSSFQTPYYTNVEIIGTEGTMVVKRPFTAIDTPAQELLFYPANSNDPQRIEVPEEYLYLGEVVDMHEAILDGKAPYLTLKETRGHVETVLALYRAAETRTAVSLPHDD